MPYETEFRIISLAFTLSNCSQAQTDLYTQLKFGVSSYTRTHTFATAFYAHANALHVHVRVAGCNRFTVFFLRCYSECANENKCACHLYSAAYYSPQYDCTLFNVLSVHKHRSVRSNPSWFQLCRASGKASAGVNVADESVFKIGFIAWIRWSLDFH